MLPSSNYQRLIYTWVEFGRGNAFINAAAGSGKTSTLVEAAKLCKGSVLILAFNRHIAEELKKKVPRQVTVRTCHGLGYGCLFRVSGKLQVRENKYSALIADRARDICDEAIREWERQNQLFTSNPRYYKHPGRPPIYREIRESLNQLVHLAMVTLCEIAADSLESLIEQFNIDTHSPFIAERLLASVAPILELGQNIAKTEKEISYDDMLYLPHRWQVYPEKRFDFVFVDEAQDLSRSQLELVLKAVKKDGRIIFCGDGKQRIYGFAGVEEGNIEEAISRTNAIELPLSICYRCGQSHVRAVQHLVPEIEPYEKNPEGVIAWIEKESLPSALQGGELILFRKGAPAVKLCLELLAAEIPAKVRGRDLGKQLANTVRSLGEISGFSMANFERHLLEWKRHKAQKKSGRALLELEDKYQAILTCYLGLNCATTDELAERIETLFSDEEKVIIISTVHRAKGLQNPTVFIDPEDMPMTWRSQTDSQYQEELNIAYVAATRAQKNLILLSKPHWKCLELKNLPSYWQFLTSTATPTAEAVPDPYAAVLGGNAPSPHSRAVVLGGRNPFLSPDSAALLVDALMLAHHELSWSRSRFLDELSNSTRKDARQMFKLTAHLPSLEELQAFLDALKSQVKSLPDKSVKTQARQLSLFDFLN